MTVLPNIIRLTSKPAHYSRPGLRSSRLTSHFPHPTSYPTLCPVTSPTGYRRSLGLFSGTMAVVGGIIGSGIFMNSAIVAQRVGTAGLTLSVWILGGVIALIGAFCFGELAQRNPQAGGSYVYLRDAFGPLPAFLYAWSLLLVIGTGAMAAVAVTFATYCSALLGLGHETVMPIAAGAIALLSAVNYVGVEPGAITNNLFSILKLIALGGLIITGLLAARRAAEGRRRAPTSAVARAIGCGLVGAPARRRTCLLRASFLRRRFTSRRSGRRSIVASAAHRPSRHTRSLSPPTTEATTITGLV